MTSVSANSFTAGIVYIAAAIICLGCAILLVRGYMRSKMRLLLWSGIFFFALTADNVIVFLDLVLFPQVNFSFWRNSVTLVGLLILIYGLIHESE